MEHSETHKINLQYFIRFEKPLLLTSC